MRFTDGRAVVAAVVALLWLAATAQAAPRYASPVGSGGTCAELNPCALQTATEGAGRGDEVIVEPGTYTSSARLYVASGVYVHGREGAPRPRLSSTADWAMDVRSGATLRNFEIHHTGASSISLALSVSGTADRVFVESVGNACHFGDDGAAILNSVCWSKGDQFSGVGAALISGSPLQRTMTLRNVTVFAQFGYGILVDAGDNVQLTINAINVSAFGVLEDVMTRETGMQGTVTATVNLDHSIFESVNADGGGLITPPGPPTNIDATASRFVNFPDFHASPGAPTIDAGITSPANGTADLDGGARAQGASTDIGAFEVPVAGLGPGGAGSSGGVSADKTKPVTSALDVQPDAFAALSGRGSSLISSKRKPARGATVNYRLSEAATVTFTVERAVRGRKKKGRCVSGRRKGKTCIRYKKLKGSFTHAGRAGANSLRFSGRLARKPLRQGRYRLVGTASDAAGNKSDAVRTSFRIVRG